MSADTFAPADIARALGDRTRLAILVALRDGERTVGDLVRALGLSQPKVSNHLAALRACGLVESRRDRRTVLNGLADGRVAVLAQAIAAIVPAEAAPSPAPRAASHSQVEVDDLAPGRLQRPSPDSGPRELVVFELGGGDYALPIADVREIVAFTRPRPLPGTATGVLGIVQVHGRLLEAIDVRARLGLPDGAPFAQLVVVEADGQTAGVPVEAVREIVTVPAAALLPPPVTSAELDVVAAVDDRLVLVLRPGAMLAAA